MNTAPSIEYPYVYDSQVIGENFEHNNSVTGFADSTERKTKHIPIRWYESIAFAIIIFFFLTFISQRLGCKVRMYADIF